MSRWRRNVKELKKALKEEELGIKGAFSLVLKDGDRALDVMSSG